MIIFFFNPYFLIIKIILKTEFKTVKRDTFNLADNIINYMENSYILEKLIYEKYIFDSTKIKNEEFSFRKNFLGAHEKNEGIQMFFTSK